MRNFYVFTGSANGLSYSHAKVGWKLVMSSMNMVVVNAFFGFFKNLNRKYSPTRMSH